VRVADREHRDAAAGGLRRREHLGEELERRLACDED